MSTYLHISVCLQSLKLDCTVKEDKQPLEILSQHDLREAFNCGEQGETPFSSRYKPYRQKSAKFSPNIMNSIVVCLFVFTLGSLAAKIPTDVNKSEEPDRNPESLEKRNLEFSKTQNSFIVRRTDSRLYLILPVKVTHYARRLYKFGRSFLESRKQKPRLRVPPLSLSPSSETLKPARKKWPRRILGARSTLLSSRISRGHIFSREFLSRLARRTKRRRAYS